MSLRKLLCTLLAAVMLLTAIPAAMAEITRTGTTESGGTWTLDDQGTLTITGDADITYDDWDYSLQNDVTRIVFGPGIQYNGNCFSYWEALTSFEVDEANPYLCAQDGVLFSKDMTALIECPTCKTGSYTIPSGVTEIRMSAFIGSHLSSIVLLEGLETIGDQAFFNAEFSTITIPASVNWIETTAFAGNQLESLQVAPGSPYYRAENNMLIEIGDGDEGDTLLAVASGVTGDVVVPVVEFVAFFAFSHSNVMDSITFQEGLLELGDGCCKGATFTTLNLPVSLETIQNGALAECAALETVNYAGTLAQWDAVAKDGNDILARLPVHCSDGDTTPGNSSGQLGENVSYTLTPDGLLTISGAGEWDKTWYFENNLYVKRAVLEYGVTELGYGAFAWCQMLRSVSIPNTVTLIHNNAFYCCSALTELTIPASVTVIEDEAFDGCDMLDDIHYGGTMAQWEALIAEGSHNDIIYINIHCTDGIIAGEAREGTIAGTCGPAAHYTYEPNETESELFIYGDGRIIEYAFAGMFESARIRLYIQPGITNIGSSAFADVSGIYYVELNNDLQTVGDYAFDGTSVEEVVFNGTQEQWDTIDFGTGNDALLNADIQFTGGSGDGPETQPCGDGVEYYIDYAYDSGDDPVVTLEIDGFGSIDAHFFEGNTELENLALTGVVSIGEYAFNGCTSVNAINLYDCLTEVGNHAFDGIDAGTLIFFHGTEEQWNQVVIGEGNACLSGENIFFMGSDDPEPELEYTWLPENLTAIEPYAFANSNLQKVFVPDSCTTIGDYAFAGCTSLYYIDLPSVTSIGEHAFDGCTNLTFWTTYENQYVIDYAEQHGIPYEEIGE